MTTFSTVQIHGRNNGQQDAIPSPGGNVTTPNPVNVSENGDTRIDEVHFDHPKMTDEEFMQSLIPQWDSRCQVYPIYLVEMHPDDQPDSLLQLPRGCRQRYPAEEAYEMVAAFNRVAFRKAEGGTPARWAIYIKQRKGKASIINIKPERDWVPKSEYDVAPPAHQFQGTRQNAQNYVELLNRFYVENHKWWAVLASALPGDKYEGKRHEEATGELLYDVAIDQGQFIARHLSKEDAERYVEMHNNLVQYSEGRAYVFGPNT